MRMIIKNIWNLTYQNYLKDYLFHLQEMVLVKIRKIRIRRKKEMASNIFKIN